MKDYFEWTNELFNLEKVFEKPEALEGVRVLDLTMVIHGPETTSLLAEFGAEVIKIEPPKMGDLIRSVSLWARFWKGASLGAMWVNRNKYHVSIDLKNPKGRDLFLKLVEKSDVVVENFINCNAVNTFPNLDIVYAVFGIYHRRRLSVIIVE